MSLILLQNRRCCLCPINIPEVTVVTTDVVQGCVYYQGHLQATVPSQVSQTVTPGHLKSDTARSMTQGLVKGLQRGAELPDERCAKLYFRFWRDMQNNIFGFGDVTCSSKLPCQPLPIFRSRPEFGFEPSLRISLPVEENVKQYKIIVIFLMRNKNQFQAHLTKCRDSINVCQLVQELYSFPE